MRHGHGLRHERTECMSRDEFEHRGHRRHRFGHGRGGERGHRGRGRRGVFDSGELRLVLLKLIGDEPRHGYDLIRAIEDLTGGAYVPSPGVVYPALSLLKDMGHIDEADSEGSRRAFSATPDGEAELADNAEKIAALLARLAALAETRDRTDAAPVRRAMENLRNAVVARLTDANAETGKELVHRTAEILDEAAQRIERL